jgi:hypothetical protein
MAQSNFPNSVWGGLSKDRPFTSVNKPVDQMDWEQLVAEIQAIESYLINNPPTIGGSVLLMGMKPNPE